MSVTEMQFGEFVETGADYLTDEQPHVYGLGLYFGIGFVVGVLLPLLMRLTLH